MSRIKTPGHYIYNEYGIMKEIQEPDKLFRGQSKLARKMAAIAITPGANFDFS